MARKRWKSFAGACFEIQRNICMMCIYIYVHSYRTRPLIWPVGWRAGCLRPTQLERSVSTGSDRHISPARDGHSAHFLLDPAPEEHTHRLCIL